MNKSEPELIDFVQGFRRDFIKMRFDQVASPRGVNGIHKYKDSSAGWVKGTPIHVRGALVYNQMIDRHSLQKKLEKVRDGDKIKFCYLLTPNPTRENVISIPDNYQKSSSLRSILTTNFNLRRCSLVLFVLLQM
jgi:hypothetical protein